MPSHISTRADDAVKHEFDVNHLLFHKGKLYSAGDDGKIKVWATDLKFLAEVQAHPCSVYCLAASDDTLFSCSNEGTVKAWSLDTLESKGTIVQENDTEFWRIFYADGVLYIGDDQGNVKIHRNGKIYGSINVAEPVKDLVLQKNLLVTVKDNDVVVTDLHLGGEVPQFGVTATLMGRAPLAILNDRLLFVNREGKDIVLNQIVENRHIKEISSVKGAHDMIINALATAEWDGQLLVFTGGWEKVVKQWKIESDTLKPEGSLNVDIVVNTLAIGDKGSIYAAGGDGHIVRIDL